jgi:hypothetical protein
MLNKKMEYRMKYKKRSPSPMRKTMTSSPRKMYSMQSESMGYGYRHVHHHGYGHHGHYNRYKRSSPYRRSPSYGYSMRRSPSYSPRYQNKAQSNIRIGHAVANGPNVNVFFDGKPVAQNVKYETFMRDYLMVSSGEHNVAIVPVGQNQKPIIDVNVSLRPNTATTAIAVGNVNVPSSIKALTFTDDLTCPSAGQAHVRFIHCASGVPPVDIRANGDVIFFDVAFSETGNPTYLPVRAGTYDIAVTLAGQNDIVIQSPLNLEDQKIYTVYATGIPGNKLAPLTAVVTEDSQGMCIVHSM